VHPPNHSQALGAADQKADGQSASSESRAMEEVERILAPVKDVSWPSGKPENSGLPF